MGYREELIELVQKWTENKIDITENWNEWEEFLTKEGYIKTYQEVYYMDLDYLIHEKDLDYWDEKNQRWNVELLIENDNDIVKMSNGCYFVHNQDYIHQYVIDSFYEEQESRRQQKVLNDNIIQAYKDIKLALTGFARFDALLFIFGHDFGYNDESLYFLSDMKKVQREILKCIQEIVALINDSIDDGSIRIWLPNHNTYSDEEDEHYCELIRFGGYEILENGHQILKSDAILLINDDGIHTLEYFTYQNMNQFCDYIAEVFEWCKNDCSDIGDIKYELEISQKINDIIDKYWGNTFEFDYAEFFTNNKGE